MAGLDHLFTRLATPTPAASSPVASSAPRSQAMAGGHSYQQPSVSSPIVSPPPQGQPPRHPEHILSANASPLPGSHGRGDSARPDQAASLLSLLTAAPSATPPNASRQGQRAEDASAPVSASDLVASFARSTPTPSRIAEAYASPSSTPLHAPRASATTAANPQDMLLTLLKRPESSSHGRGISNGNAENASPASARGSGGIGDIRSLPTAIQHTTPGAAAHGSLFSHRDPFDSLPAVHASKGAPHQPTAFHGATGFVTPQPSNEPSLDTTGIAAANPLADGGESGKELRAAVHEAAIELTAELQDGKTKHQLEQEISRPVAAALQATAAAVASTNVADTWESAGSEETSKPDASRYKVRVYNLPMRPFVSLEVNAAHSAPSIIRPDVVMKIASLKKEFDQIDRTLATASSRNIVYAMTKGGGFRIIRQDDGSNKTVFRQIDNQIFNIAITSSPKSDDEAVLATGVNGAVFWTPVPSKLDASAEDLASRSLIFPPPPSPDENTSTAQLKTRVQKSNRHSGFFAYGRSKTIYLVWPSIAQLDQYSNKKTHMVDSVKYLAERSVRIVTGKAGKDFTFSEDDTTIVSLDKHGKLKFWDISGHIGPDLEQQPLRHLPIEIKEPIMTLWVSSTAARSWPTSVRFVDKDRPTTKGLALRYMLVGLKQNHTIQLWDLGLGKAVQELNLPHSNETDAICSIAYHSKSGIIVVGHPTRNSLYFIHLSAPKYNLPPMSQAKYMSALESKDKALPRPESTAIMSGLREVSFSSIGELRSVDVISASQPNDEQDPSGETVFEVYTMHSRGVTCLNMKRQDLGWGEDGKVADPEDGEREKVVSVSELQLPAPASAADPEDATSRSTEIQSKTSAKSSTAATPSLPKADAKKELEAALSKTTAVPSPAKPAGSGTEKADKKKKKRIEDAEPQPASSKMPVPDAQQLAAQAEYHDKDVAPATPAKTEGNAPSLLAGSLPQALPATPAPAPADLTKSFSDVVDEHMKGLYRRIVEDRRVADATSNSRQDMVLRLVSSTLTDNVEQTLSQIITTSIRDSVLPALTEATSSTLDNKAGQVISQQLGLVVPREMKAGLSEAIGKTVQSQQFQQVLANSVTTKINAAVEKQLPSIIQGQLSEALSGAAAEAGVSVSKEASRRFDEIAQLAKHQSQRDAVEIGQLKNAVAEMTSLVASMATAQATLVQEVRSLRAEFGQNTTSSRDAPTAIAPAAEAVDPEIEAIAVDLGEGRYEQGTIKWLQSSKQEELFERLFSRMDPSYLHGVNQIVLLSVAASVSQTLADSHFHVRLNWLEVALGAVDAQSAEIADFAPRMMDIMIERLSEEYMRLSEGATDSRTLTRIHTLVRRAKEIKTTVKI